MAGKQRFRVYCLTSLSTCGDIGHETTIILHTKTPHWWIFFTGKKRSLITAERSLRPSSFQSWSVRPWPLRLQPTSSQYGPLALLQIRRWFECKIKFYKVKWVNRRWTRGKRKSRWKILVVRQSGDKQLTVSDAWPVGCPRVISLDDSSSLLVDTLNILFRENFVKNACSN